MIHGSLSGVNIADNRKDTRSVNSVLDPRVKFFMKTVATLVDTATRTIGHLARAAGVGVETIRYYQELGLTLAEMGELLRLEDGADRPSIRRIANARLVQIIHKIADLERMRNVLTHLVEQCEHTKKNLPCPIIATLANVRTADA